MIAFGEVPAAVELVGLLAELRATFGIEINCRPGVEI